MSGRRPDWAPVVLVAADSFKGSLGQREVVAAIAAGVARVLPQAKLVRMPLSDGGEGWLETLVAAGAGRVERVPTLDPLGHPVEGLLGVIDKGRTAVIEVASASGLGLVSPSPETFRVASSAGTGMLIQAALDAGARRVLIGLGGSATTDGGIGMAVALGARALDKAGAPLPPGGAALAELETLDLSGLDPRLTEAEVLAATDVDNPLTGQRGAAAVYGPQKGARPADVQLVDGALGNLADRLAAVTGRDLGQEPGMGAAGGLGFGLVAICGARLARGIELALDAVGFDAALAEADLVITGEGRIDSQTLRGKVVAGMAGRCRAAGIPVFAIGGAVDPSAYSAWEEFEAAGVTVLQPTLEEPIGLAAALEPEAARDRVLRAAERLTRTLAAGRALAEDTVTPLPTMDMNNDRR